MKQLSITAFALIVLILNACNSDVNELKPSGKEESKVQLFDNDNANLTPTEAQQLSSVFIKTLFLAGLRSKDWVLYKVTADSVDLTHRIPECILDNIFRIYRNNYYAEKDGATSCNEEGQPPIKLDEGAWHFNANGTKLFLEARGSVTEYKVLEITPVKLVLESFDEQEGIKLQQFLRPRGCGIPQ